MSKIPDATPEVESQIRPEAVTERVESIRERIAQACGRAGRSPDEITVVAVSKTFPMQAIASGTGVGLEHFGENRARQLRDKAKARPGAVEGGDVLVLDVDGDLNRLAAGFAREVRDAGGTLMRFRGFLVVTPPGVGIDTDRLS